MRKIRSKITVMMSAMLILAQLPQFGAVVYAEEQSGPEEEMPDLQLNEDAEKELEPALLTDEKEDEESEQSAETKEEPEDGQYMDQETEEETEDEPDTVPDDIVLGGPTFDYNDIYTSGLPEGECYISGCGGDKSGALVIPASVFNTANQRTYKVVGISNGAFSGDAGFTSLSLPDTIRVIQSNAFADCTGLRGNLVIPGSVTSIETDAFARCTGLKGTLKLPAGLTEISGSSFEGCGFTGQLNIPSSVKKINRRAFADCKGFTGTLTLPDSITEMGEEAFADCTGFTGLKLPAGISFINDRTFSGCTGMTGTLTFPDKIAEIGDRAFFKCGFTGDLTLPKKINTICGSSLALPKINGTLTIPSGLKTVEAGSSGDSDEKWCPFYGMYKVKKVINKSSTGIEVSGNFVKRDGSDFFTREGSMEICETLDKGTFIRGGEKNVKATIISAENNIYNGYDCITVKWKVTRGAEGYLLERKAGSGKWKLLQKTYDTSWNDINVKNGTKYQYRVRAYNRKYKSKYSKTVTIIRLDPPNTNSPVGGKKKVTFSWKKNKKADGYQIQCGPKRNVSKNKKIDVKKKTSYTKSKLKSRQTYYLRVRCYKKSGKTTYYSAWSAVRNGTAD